jgi:hypothetical protein
MPPYNQRPGGNSDTHVVLETFISGCGEPEFRDNCIPNIARMTENKDRTGKKTIREESDMTGKKHQTPSVLIPEHQIL